MHIQIDGDDRGSYDLKWRGVALSNFDGRNWSNAHAQRPLMTQLEGHFILPARSAGCAGYPPGRFITGF